MSERLGRDDLVLDVVGNTSPFSMAGESSGYMVTVDGRSFLLECGARVFPSLGPQGVGNLCGIFASHSHEDHKRWFTDVVLFTFYNPTFDHRVRLISSEPVLEEFAETSKAALERSLSVDSKRVSDIPFERMVERVPIGPRSRYFVHLEPHGDGAFHWEVRDRAERVIGPERAKIVFHPECTRPRLLLRDEENGEWVEPESYYPFSCERFYEREQNAFVDEASGLVVEAVKSPVWHGLPTVGFRFRAGENRLLFSGDTVYDRSLWESLYRERRPQRFESISREAFLRSPVIYGDINDFIERTWSRERYEAALKAYDGAVVVHDVARKNSVVHTDYSKIADAPIGKLIFTHSPDNLTALRPILHGGQRIVLHKGDVYESVGGRLYPLNADVYVRHFGGNFVGYGSPDGTHKVIEQDGLLGVVDLNHSGEERMRVDLYEDVGGEYFPLLEEPNAFYRPRADGRVERVTLENDASRGVVVENLRDGLPHSP